MKQVINGITYDTETANKIGCYECRCSDIFLFRETLYQDVKNRNIYFLYWNMFIELEYFKKVYDPPSFQVPIIMPISVDVANKWHNAHIAADGFTSKSEDSIE